MRLMRFKAVWLAAMAGLVLTACAPQKPRYEFVPPASASGMACVQQCTAQQRQCGQRVTQQHNQCLVRARQQAVTELPGRLAAYEKNIVAWEAAMRRYERDMDLYELQRRHSRIMHELSVERCREREGKGKRDCRPLRPLSSGLFFSDRPVYPGKAPRRPTLQNVQAEIAAEQCSKSTEVCENTYRQCYTGCGGTVKQY